MHCYFCHGYSGDARTVASGYLDPPPRDFTASDPTRLTRERMLNAVRRGKSGTAMMAFASQLDETDIAAVVDFIRQRFMRRQRYNTRYHTEANGWHDFDRYAAAFPFATGQRAIDAADLKPSERRGLQLFMATCLTCHEGRSHEREGLILDARPVSFPRGGYTPAAAGVDAVSSATPYARHDQAPRIDTLTPLERQGERLFQANCAFCHAADGSGRNWIGSFLEPHPRNLTDAEAMQGMTQERLRDVIADGLEGTTMSAWKHVLEPDQIDAISAYVMRAFVPAQQK
jgi:cytochrome c oxidase cbb3-type subunit 3